MKWIRKSAGTVPRAKARAAVFAGTCACGSQIRVGELYYRERGHRIRCQTCERKTRELAQQGLSSHTHETPGQLLVDRIRQLLSLPGSDRNALEIESSLFELLRSHPGEFVEFSTASMRRLHPEMHLMKARRLGQCATCRASIAVGAVMSWHRRRRFVWCGECTFAKIRQTWL